MDKNSENGWNHEKDKKTPVKFFFKSDHKNVENSDIGPDSEMLTSNT